VLLYQVKVKFLLAPEGVGCLVITCLLAHSIFSFTTAFLLILHSIVVAVVGLPSPSRHFATIPPERWICNMNSLERILSRPVAKPYRSKGIKNDVAPYLNSDGLLDFSPGDIENPKNWSTRRRIYITVVAVFLVVNATFASSGPSGNLRGISEEFKVSQEVSGLVITLFLLGKAYECTLIVG
jgi:hypothetical protein